MKTLWRLLCALSIAVLPLLPGCGGGESEVAAPALLGSRDSRTITANISGTSYPLQIYLPPASAGPRNSLPVVYALDGESWFETLVGVAERNGARMIIVAIGNPRQRGRDYVPQNSCTPDGGGHADFFQFIAQQLIPYVETTFGGAPGKRALMGHSHGGSFVLYAMFAQAPDRHLFSAYLSSDASVSCMTATAYAWEQDYAAAHGSDLPVRLHLSYATGGNIAANEDYASRIRQRRYSSLVMASQAYSGTHSGIMPAVLADAVPFAFAAAP